MASHPETRPDAPPQPGNRRRWLVLAVVAMAQLMIVLDITIVNIALPSAQKALHFANTDRQWVITAYALAFGSLLLIGGRIGDLFGRKRTFTIGLVGFALASAFGGAAGSFGMLAGARAVQGVFGALLAPAALSTLTVTFTEPGERGKAFGIFGAVAGGGSAVGLVLGGLLTEGLSWRWCLYVNLIFAAVALVGALLFLPPQERKARTTLDLPGTLLASAGLFCIVYGFSHAASASWSSGLTVASLVAGVVLLTAFVVLERRVANPLLPLRIILDRTRGGALLAVVISGAAIFGVFLFLTFYLQGIKGYSPIVTGLMYLPMTACIVAASTTANIRLLPRTGPRPLAAGGMALGCVAMLLLSRLGVSSTYPGGVLPALLVLGLGFGLIFAPAINGSTAGVAPDDAGVASAMVNTMQQVGGSIGTALLATVATGATTSYLAAHHGLAFLARGAVHGYHVAFLVSAGTFLAGGVVCGLLLPSRKLPDPRAAAVPAAA